MNSTIHERPGVYSSYDASSVVSASAAAKTIGAAAVATKGTANKVELITSYEEGKSVFGEDASGVYGMSTLLKFLFANGAGAVKAVAVGKDESEEKDYASAFAALSDEEDVGVMVCDSAAQSVHLLLKTAAEDASAARRERIAVIGGSEETVAQMVNRAKAVNSERVVLVGPDIASDDGGTMSAVFAAAAVLVCGFAAGASAGGLARWYMSAAVLLGAVSWRWAVQPAVHRAAAALAELACRPLRLVHKMLVRPAQMRLQAAQSRRRACRKAKKSAKIKKSAEKRLQKPSKVLYN